MNKKRRQTDTEKETVSINKKRRQNVMYTEKESVSINIDNNEYTFSLMDEIRDKNTQKYIGKIDKILVNIINTEISEINNYLIYVKNTIYQINTIEKCL